MILKLYLSVVIKACCKGKLYEYRLEGSVKFTENGLGAIVLYLLMLMLKLSV